MLRQNKSLITFTIELTGSDYAENELANKIKWLIDGNDRATSSFIVRLLQVAKAHEWEAKSIEVKDARS